jgi:iron complex outermembrane receptor protein
VEGAFGEFGRTDGKGSFNFPLGDKAGLQVAGMFRRFTGYDRDTFSNRDVNDQKIGGGRFSLRLLPTSRLNILLVGDLLRERSLPAFPVAFVPQAPFISTTPPFGPNPAGFGIGPTDITKQIDGDSDIHTLGSDLGLDGNEPRNDLDQNGISGTILWSANDRTTIKSVTGYRDLSHNLLLDADGRVGNFLNIPRGGRPAPSFHLFQDQEQDQFSQELQVQGQAGARVRYLAGVYYFHEDNRQRTENLIFNFLGANNYWDTGLDTDSRAVYGSATIRASDRLTLTAGIRYTSDNKVFDTNVFLPGGAPLVACVSSAGAVIGAARPCTPADPAGSVSTPVEKHLDETWDAFTPRFALDFQATPELLFYGSASRGFKSGAFDGRLNTAATVLGMQPIAPETLWTYEGGFKSDWFQNRLRFNATGFFNDWSNLQGTGTDPAGNFIRITVGDVETKGAEFEARGVPVRGLELAGQLSFLRTEYTSVDFDQFLVCGPLGTATKELELKASPHTSYFVGFTYTTPGVTAGGRWSIGSSVAGKTQFWHTSCNADTGSEDGYTLVDAWLAYETRDGRFRVTVAGDNLADEQYITGSFAVAGLRMSSGYFNPPRRFSVTLRYGYN